jgi:PIN domain nuclease of toxin-antitoxin system
MKRCVADTHVVLWFAAGDLRRLGRAARRVMASLGTGRAEIIVSVVSLWEVALLHDDRHLRLTHGFGAWCDALESMSGVSVVSLTRSDIEHARALRSLRDPHDRLIAGTAQRLDVPLLSADARIAEHGVPVIWD